MKSPISFCICHELAAFFVHLPGFFQIFILYPSEIILVNKVVTRVVRRIDVDHLDLAEVGLLEELEGIQVIALDKQILRGIKIHALFPAGAQGFGDGRVGGQQRLPFPWPVEVVALLRAFDDMPRKFLAEQIEVEGISQG